LGYELFGLYFVLGTTFLVFACPPQAGLLGLFLPYFLILDTSYLILFKSPRIPYPLFKKNSCDIYGKGVTNSSKNSSVNFLHSISIKKIVCFEEKRILMKRLFYSVIVTLLFSLSAFAQNEGISFQGLARNAAGEVLVSQKISLRLSILLDTESGAVAYAETRQVTTNPQGIFSLVVGDDKALTKSTNFSSINWTPAPKFIKVEMDPNAGTSYVAMGTSRLQAVPFAFHAYGVDASNVKGVLPLGSGGTGVASISDLKTSLGVDQINNTSDASKPISTATQAALNTKANDADVTSSLATKANASDVTTSLATKVDKVTGKELSTNDYTTAEKTKLAAITGTNTGDQDLSSFATTTQLAAKANSSDVTTSLATKVDKVTGKELSTNDYTTAEKTKLAAITGTNTGDQVNITGNAGTATKLQTSRTINGIAFDGSADITLPTPASGIPYTGATQAVDLGAYNLTVMTVNGITLGRGLNGNTDSNIAIGKDVLRSVTGGSYLTAVGHEALYSNTTGYNNTAIGSAALKANTSGLANTSIGSNSLQSNTTANFVTAVGNHALRYNTTGGNNTAVGSGALEFNTSGELNSAFGYDALKKNTTGSRNTATGVNALVDNTTGSENTATGFGALLRNTTGSRNTATGQYALALNTTGDDNTAFGHSALYPNTTGTKNTAVGQGALKNNSTGFENSALGEGTLANNTTGKYNSAFGRESLHNSNGDNNTAIGWRAGFQTGSNNTSVGYMAGYAAGTKNTAIGASADFAANVTDATAIGYGARANGNNASAIGNGAVAAANTIRLGNTAVTSIGGQVAWTAASDSRIKKNIVNSTYGLATVLKLRPVEYNLTSNDLKQVGFIAQEVQKLVPEVVTGKEGDLSKGEILGITYSNLVPVLTKAIQEQQKQIEDQNSKIAAQQKQIEELIKLVKGQ
jgi:hypothetical protein